MGRYTGPACRLCRREGMKLYLKGEKCFSDKCPVHKRAVPPGMHGQGVRHKTSEFGLRLREKQKLRRIYGVLERQFKRYFEVASKATGVTGTRLLQLLESRLDNVVFRLGLASSRKEARMLVTHGHIAVNGRKVNIPSYLVSPGDVITLTARGKENARVQALLAEAGARGRPSWLEFNLETLEAKVLGLPSREEIDVPINEQLVVEYYSR